MLGVDARQVRLLDATPDELPGGGLALLVRVRPKAQGQGRCPVCRRRCSRYDRGRERRWRSLDFGRIRVFVVAQAPRVRCPEHGVLVAAVPWARHRARHTVGFEQQAAWCAVEMSASAATRLMRCSWRTVGEMVGRVAADLAQRRDGDGLDGLARIGIDEVSYRRGHKYLIVIVDLDRKRLVWAREGRSTKTLIGFFDQLGPVRTSALTHVAADGARWITDAVDDRAPDVVQCADPFHVVAWAMEALDLVRRDVWHQIRREEAAAGRRRGMRASPRVATLNKTRWALWKNPARHSDKQRAQLRWIAANHPRLHRAWQLKEGLRTVFGLAGEDAVLALDRWLSWARRCRMQPFVDLARRVQRFHEEIAATLNCGLSTALVESMNTKIRLITRRAFGFRNTDNLIALAFLTLGGKRPELPT
jgi:transposase